MTSHVLERGPARIHYETHGEASERLPLLLTHGYSATSAMWTPNLPVLAADRLVITWDIRGHGHTQAPLVDEEFTPQRCVEDMAAILDASGVDRAAIGGLSLGGFLSLAFNLVHPERVSALALFDTGPGYKDDGARDGWNRYVSTLVAAFERDGLAALGDSPEVVGGPHDAAGLVAAGRGILTQHDRSVIESLPSIAVPTLVVVGENDTPFLRAADYMATRIPNAERHVIAGAGHASNIDRADEFDTLVSAFLRRVDTISTRSGAGR